MGTVQNVGAFTLEQEGLILDSNIALIINAILYTLTLLIYIRNNKFSVGVVVWGLYTLAAWTTFLFVQQPYYRVSIHYSEQRLFPFLYMYVINLIAITPLTRLKKIPKIRFSGEKIIFFIMIISVVLQFLFIVIDLPNMLTISKMTSSALNDLRNSGYDSNSSLVESYAGLNKIYLLFSGLRIIVSGLSIYTLISYKKHRFLVYMFFVITLINNIRIIINQAGRGEIVMLFLLYACVFYSLRDEIDNKIMLPVLTAAIPVSIAGVAFFWTVTVARFGDYAVYTLYKYLGEPMNNFNGLLFYKIEGYTLGRAYFSLLYRYLLGVEDFITTSEKWWLINSITGIDGSLFYTWIGGLVIEFGYIIPFIIAIILNRLLNCICDLDEYRVGDLIVVIFFLNLFLRGIFHFPVQNFDGNLMMIYTILLYLCFRIEENKQGGLVYVIPHKYKRRIQK